MWPRPLRYLPAQITDFAGSTNFILVALLAFFGGGGGSAAATAANPRAVIVTTLLCIARVELALFLLYRCAGRGRLGGARWLKPACVQRRGLSRRRAAVRTREHVNAAARLPTTEHH